jgi:hypothetical protein
MLENPIDDLLLTEFCDRFMEIVILKVRKV